MPSTITWSVSVTRALIRLERRGLFAGLAAPGRRAGHFGSFYSETLYFSFPD